MRPVPLACPLRLWNGAQDVSKRPSTHRPADAARAQVGEGTRSGWSLRDRVTSRCGLTSVRGDMYAISEGLRELAVNRQHERQAAADAVQQASGRDRSGSVRHAGGHCTAGDVVVAQIAVFSATGAALGISVKLEDSEVHAQYPACWRVRVLKSPRRRSSRPAHPANSHMCENARSACDACVQGTTTHGDRPVQKGS